MKCALLWSLLSQQYKDVPGISKWKTFCQLWRGK